MANSSKGQVRDRKRLKRALRRAGACLTCAPMLPHGAAAGRSAARLNCPSCGRAIAFPLDALEAYDALARGVGGFYGACPNGYTIRAEGREAYARACGCDLPHADFQVTFAGEGGAADG